ncbi:MAG TPA: hypothetical protein VFZ67_00220 [Nitrososphaera sp.]
MRSFSRNLEEQTGFFVNSTRPSNTPAVTIDSKTTRISIKPVMGSEWQVSESEGLANTITVRSSNLVVVA